MRTIVLVICEMLFLLLGCSAQATRSVTDESSESQVWLSDHYSAILDAVMPKGPVDCPTADCWVVTVRVTPPFESDFEYWFQLEQKGQLLRMCTIIPQQHSIRNQILELKKLKPNFTEAELASAIVVAQRCRDSGEFPELAGLAKRLKAVRMPVLDTPPLAMDETLYDYWSTSAWGYRVKYTLTGGAVARRQPYSLLEWIVDFRKAAR